MGIPRFDVDLAFDDVAGPVLHEFLRRARDAGPVVGARFAGMDAWMITRFDTLRDFFTDQEQFPGGVGYQFTTRPHIGSTFIDLDGAEHDTVRRLVTPAFRSRAVTRFVDSDLTPLVHEVIDRWEPTGNADLARDLAQVLPFWSISRKLGLPRGSEEQQRTWALAMLDFPNDPDGARAAAEAVTEFLMPTVEQRRREPTDDVISGLLSGEVHGVRLTDEQVVSHIRLIYTVGAATTSDGLSTLLHRVVTEPGLLGRLVDDPSLVPAVVHESLRMEPPVSVLPRVAANGGEIAGVEIPPMAPVLCAIASANRDESVYADPDRFDPDRAEAEILTFGFGSKFCPGSHLARQQMAAALAAVVERLPDLRLVSATEPVNAVLRRVEHLRVEWPH